ncbi:uncharacterized protein LOC144646134 [Oculina patagonica]
MKVICAGLSKTGTQSLAKALRILGHTVRDYQHHKYTDTDEWIGLYYDGKEPDYASMYEHVDAVIGLPTSFWYEEILKVFPEAKVILTVRWDGEDGWVKSWASDTALLFNPGFLKRLFARSRHPKRWMFMDAMCFSTYGTVTSTSTVLAKKKYREHNERVQAVIPKEKLLVYNVKQGWKPLCEFLGCEIPDQEFPRANVGSSVNHQLMASQFPVNVNLLLTILAVLALLGSIFLYKLWYL